MASQQTRKKRVDDLVVADGLAPDLATARRLIMAGEIRSGDRLLDRADEKVPVGLPLEHRPRRGGLVSQGSPKLMTGLDAFGVSPEGCRCLDVGASTGGFTHVLLERGAASVTALDVGKGLLDHRLRSDPRVTVCDQVNFRLLPPDHFPEPFDLVVIDVSFISLRLILPRAAGFLRPDGSIIALVKPQFEAAREEVAKGGLVRDPAVHQRILADLKQEIALAGLVCRGETPYQADQTKNVEFLTWWRRAPSP